MRRSGLVSRAQRALLIWLDRIEPGMEPRAFARRYGDAALQERLERIARSCYRDNSGDVSGFRHLLAPLAEARRGALRAIQDDSRAELPPLNP